MSAARSERLEALPPLVLLMNVVVTASLRVAGLDGGADSGVARVASVVIFTSGPAALGDAGLAWLLALSMARPLSLGALAPKNLCNPMETWQVTGAAADVRVGVTE